MKKNVMNKPIKTNLEQLDEMTDEMIDTSDIPPLTEDFFTKAKWRMPKPKVKVMVEIEPEVAAWFQSQGHNWELYMAEALRTYAQVHQGESSIPLVG